MSWSTALNFKNSNHLDTTSKQNILHKVKYSMKHWKIFFRCGYRYTSSTVTILCSVRAMFV